MARVFKGSHSFTCTPRVHPLTEWTIAAQENWFVRSIACRACFGRQNYAIIYEKLRWRMRITISFFQWLKKTCCNSVGAKLVPQNVQQPLRKTPFSQYTTDNEDVLLFGNVKRMWRHNAQSARVAFPLLDRASATRQMFLLLQLLFAVIISVAAQSSAYSSQSRVVLFTASLTYCYRRCVINNCGTARYYI